VMLIVTFINACLGLFQEYRAEQSLGALKQMLAVHARVRRNGQVIDVPAETLVPGDVVVLDAGARMPADGKLVVAESMEVDESSLTGESHPVAKDSRKVLPEEAALGERINHGFMNTMVTRGRGEMLVTATGMETEIGKLAEALAESEEPPTPLQVQLDGLGKRLATIGLGFVVLILGLGLWNAVPWKDALLQAIALAVATVPEGLPAVVTVTLALGMSRMARNRAIVKRLAAVETLGCTTVICSDKTGTLTLNQMTARAFMFQGRRFRVTGEGYQTNGAVQAEDGGAVPDLAPMLFPFALCNDSRLSDGKVLGDPMEGALLVLAAKAGMDRDRSAEAQPRVGEVPFDADHKFMATFHRVGTEVVLYVKGAPEALAARSVSVLFPGGIQPLEGGAKRLLDAENARLAGQQLRVLAAATRSFPAASFDGKGDLWKYLEKLTIMGLVGLMDAPRPEVKPAVDNCRQAGIAVKMITGDQRDTAVAIARELGIGDGGITGAELDQVPQEQAAETIQRTSVFARVTAAHKMKIVEALQAGRHVVAMTGDGVNDAPALKKAHIGVAMGLSGTEVAKEASQMVLTDDNFATIVGAVREGRTIYSNIVKFVRYQLSTNIGALLSMFVASLFGWLPPFSTIQILWINIIMDGPPAMAMGLDPARPEVMREPPRAVDAEILSWRRLGLIMTFGAIMVAGTLGMLRYGQIRGESDGYALTMAFTTFVWFQIFNSFNARLEQGTVFSARTFSNLPLWLSLAGVALLQTVAVEWEPAQAIFRTTGLSTDDWMLCIAVSAAILVFGELFRLVRGMLPGDPRAQPR